MKVIVCAGIQKKGMVLSITNEKKNLKSIRSTTSLNLKCIIFFKDPSESKIYVSVIRWSIIDLLKQNHEETFEKVYHETKASVYAMIFSITRSHPQAEDLMQDVYMKMLIKIDQYRVGTNFKNWLLQIAKHQAIDEYRKKQKVQYVDEHTVDLMSMTQDVAPDQDDLMNHMMEQLNEIERQIN